GGGLPVGAYGAADNIMETVAPLGPMYQAGTLSGNPIAMAAGVAMLQYLSAHPEIYKQLESLSDMLVKGIVDAAKAAGVPISSNRVGSMFTFFFQNGIVRDWASAEKSDTKLFGGFHRAMLEAGVYLPPSQFEAAFMSAAHSAADVNATIDAARTAFKQM